MILNIAGAFSKFNILSKFFLINKIYIDHNITVYDSIGNCEWNGGRLNRNINYTETMLKFYYSRNINIALTFSNHIVDLNNQYGNELLTKFHKKNNKIIVANENLYNYIKSNFPNYTLIYSITGLLDLNVPMKESDIMFYKELELKYDYIVPREEHLFDKLFKNLNPNKYEIMLSPTTCTYNCPLLKYHYHVINESNIIHNKIDDNYKLEKCILKYDKTYSNYEWENIIDPNNHIHILLNKGFNNFKISGRELSDERYYDQLRKHLKNLNILAN